MLSAATRIGEASQDMMKRVEQDEEDEDAAYKVDI